jgi:hypothetical protein
MDRHAGLLEVRPHPEKVIALLAGGGLGGVLGGR